MKRLTSLWIWLAAFCALVIFTVPMLRLWHASTTEFEETALLSPAMVRGVDLIRDNTPTTLNFNQQKWLIHYVNQGEVIDITPTTPHPLGEAVIVYRFGSTPFSLVPRTNQAGELVWQIEMGQRLLHITDSSEGVLLTLLSAAYDHTEENDHAQNPAT